MHTVDDVEFGSSCAGQIGWVEAHLADGPDCGAVLGLGRNQNDVSTV